MKILLTSSGIRNASIRDALVELLGKPIAESSALLHSHRGANRSRGGPSHVLRVHQRVGRRPYVRLGLEVLGSAGADRAAQHQRGVLGSGGPGKSTLCWSGAASPLSLLLDAAVRAGRPLTVAAARHGLRRHERRCDGRDDYDGGETLVRTTAIRSPAGDKALGLVDFSLFPHLYREDDIPATPLAEIEAWAARCQCLRTRLTIKPPSQSLTAPSRSSPRGAGSCLPPARKQALLNHKARLGLIS